MSDQIEDHPLNRGAAATPDDPDSRRDMLVAATTMVVGVVLIIAGYIGVSGTTETIDQVSFLASASLPGAAALIAGAVLAVRAAVVSQQRETAALRSQVDAVVAWLSSATSDEPSAEESS